MGQTEAPLTIRPFLAGLTQSELFTVMASGMAHVSGAVMAAYVMIAGVEIRHLLTAVIMTAPATLMLAKMLMPETGQPVTAGGVKVEVEKPGVNIIDAASRGRVRRFAAGAEHRRHADCVYRADRYGERDPERRYTTRIICTGCRVRCRRFWAACSRPSRGCWE